MVVVWSLKMEEIISFGKLNALVALLTSNQCRKLQACTWTQIQQKEYTSINITTIHFRIGSLATCLYEATEILRSHFLEWRHDSAPKREPLFVSVSGLRKRACSQEWPSIYVK